MFKTNHRKHAQNGLIMTTIDRLLKVIVTVKEWRFFRNERSLAMTSQAMVKRWWSPISFFLKTRIQAKIEEIDSDFEIIDDKIDEVEEKPIEFTPGWVAREEVEEKGTSNKGKLMNVKQKKHLSGLPNRSKWAKDVNAFEVAAYQPAPTKTGAYLKLQKTLKQKTQE